MLLNGNIYLLSAFLPFNFTWRNTFLYRTYVETQMTADTIIVQFRPPLFFIPVNGLMCPVIARYVASSASNALFFIKFWQNLKIAVQFLRRNDIRQSAADELIQLIVTSLIHKVHKAICHIFHNPIPILHDRGCNLNIPAAQSQEFRGIPPCFDSADSRNLQIL